MGIIETLQDVTPGEGQDPGEAFGDILSGDLGGEEVDTVTGTGPIAGTRGAAALTGARAAIVGGAGLLAQSNSRNIGDVARVTADPSHADDVPEDSLAADVINTDLVATDMPGNDSGDDDSGSPVTIIAEFLSFLLDNARTISIGVAALVVIQVVGKLFTFNIGDSTS